MNELHFNPTTLKHWRYINEGAKYITFTYIPPTNTVTDTPTDPLTHAHTDPDTDTNIDVVTDTYYNVTNNKSRNYNNRSDDLYINKVIKINKLLLSQLSHHTITLHHATNQLHHTLHYSNQIINQLIGRAYCDVQDLIYINGHDIVSLKQQSHPLRAEKRLSHENIDYHVIQNMMNIPCIFMNDCTVLHSNELNDNDNALRLPTLCIELKPKWAHLSPTTYYQHPYPPEEDTNTPSYSTYQQSHSNQSDNADQHPHLHNCIKQHTCRYCIHQHYKLYCNEIHCISQYCPLELFHSSGSSGNSEDQWSHAVNGLLSTPQNNLSVYLRHDNTLKQKENVDVNDNSLSNSASLKVIDLCNKSDIQDVLHTIFQLHDDTSKSTTAMLHPKLHNILIHLLSGGVTQYTAGETNNSSRRSLYHVLQRIKHIQQCFDVYHLDSILSLYHLYCQRNHHHGHTVEQKDGNHHNYDNITMVKLASSMDFYTYNVQDAIKHLNQHEAIMEKKRNQEDKCISYHHHPQQAQKLQQHEDEKKEQGATNGDVSFCNDDMNHTGLEHSYNENGNTIAIHQEKRGIDNILRDFLISTTCKDLSIMITMYIVPYSDTQRKARSDTHIDAHSNTNVTTILLNNREYQIQYQIKCIDLDMKELNKIPYYHDLDRKILRHYIEKHQITLPPHG